MTSTLFTVRHHYYATGEGWLDELAVLSAADALEAREIFLDTLGYTDGRRHFFLPQVVVTPGVDPAALGEWLTAEQIARLGRTLPYNGRFSLRFFFDMF